MLDGEATRREFVALGLSAATAAATPGLGQESRQKSRQESRAAPVVLTPARDYGKT